MPEHEIRWERFPVASATPRAMTWLLIQQHLGLARNTILAYARAIEGYLAFAAEHQIDVEQAGREHIARYVRDLLARPSPRGERVRRLDSGVGLANATLQQRLTAVRRFYDYLVEEGVRATNPVGRGRYTAGKGFGGERGLLPRYHTLPWIPDDQEWGRLLAVARAEPLRNRLMLALAYDCALRREELCGLAIPDIDPANRLVRVRPEITKGRRERIVPYTDLTSALYGQYLAERSLLSRHAGPLFLSESRRNRAHPVTIWTWSKVVARLADGAGVARFTTHTPRHLRLTDLARSGWDLHEIAQFAGHRSTETTLRYIHLSGRDLTRRLARGMAQIHAWREQLTAEALT
jgi:integrase/recombinase XerD